MKWILDVVMMMGIGTAAFFGGGSLYRSATSMNLIYAIDDLPAFRDLQDYTPTPYAPFVRLESKDHALKQGDFFCSGTVISDDYVLTAAHCLMEHGPFGGVSMKTTINVVSVNKAPFDSEPLTVVATAAAANTRADYALVKGDFSKFSKARINYSTKMVNSLVGPIVTCGNPWGDKFTCYGTNNQMDIAFEQFSMGGLMYPGMSGGAVMDVGGAQIIGVNTAVGQGYIIISPLVGLFTTLGVKVIE